MNKNILEKLVYLKNQFLDEGFIIKGVFGSYVRNENTPNSDIDILYILSPKFRDRYKGFRAIARLDYIQDTISNDLGIKVDLVQRTTLNSISAKYIIPEAINVE